MIPSFRCPHARYAMAIITAVLSLVLSLVNVGSRANAQPLNVDVELAATEKPSYEYGPLSHEQIESLQAVGLRFLNWIRDEQRRQRLLPTGYYEKIAEKSLCSKAEELLPEPDVHLDNRVAVIKWITTSDIANSSPVEELALSPYYLARAIKVACRTRELLFYDSRYKLGGEEDAYTEGYPSCSKGPELTIRPQDTRSLLSAMNAFEHLNALVFACIGAKSPPKNPMFMDVKLTNVDDVLILNSRFTILTFMESKIGRLRIKGTLEKALPSVGTSESQPNTENRPGATPEQPFDAIYPGTRIETLTVSRSELDGWSVSGSALGTAIVVSSSIKDQAVISRSEIGRLSLSGVKAKGLNLWQVRVAAGGADRGHFMDHGALQLNDNDFEQDLRIGSLDDLGASMKSIMPPALFDEKYGPIHPLFIDNPATIRLRGYVTLAQTRIGGQLYVGGMDMAGQGFGEPSSGNESEREAFFNINKLSARNIWFTSNNLRFGKQSMFLGEDVAVTNDMRWTNNVLHRRLTDEADPMTINRSHVSMEVSSFSLIGLNRLKARNVEFVQNLLIGPITLLNPLISTLSVASLPLPPDKLARWADACVGALPSEEDATDRLRSLPGGFEFRQISRPPVNSLKFPPCYGSIVVKGGTLDQVVASAMLSDLFVTGAQVKNGVSVAGRISGVLNLANIQTKDGVVTLGETGRPLLWCKDGQLLMDGVRIAALQADRDSFRYRDCDQDNALLKGGPLRMSMRVARIDQIMGIARTTMDENTDSGLLGLSADDLKVIAAPRSPIPASDRGALAEKSRSRNDFDPQTLSLLATRLREAGYVANANELAMERVSRQRWDGGETLDRLKWLFGWPIGWGYQTELAFVYAIIFILVGAWVSAYYRDYPEHSPPDQAWIQTLVNGRRPVKTGSLRAAAAKVLSTVASIMIPLAALLWFPDVLSLSPNQTLLVVAIIVLGQVIIHLRLIAFFQSPNWKERLLRMAAAGRHLGYHHFFFSLDRFLPSPGFHSYWGNYPRIGQTGRNYFYLHRLIGLLLISITAAGAVGLFE